MILVTGGAGYIGSHCVLALLNQGYEVLVFDNFSTGHKEIVEKFEKVKIFQGDLQNIDDIEEVFKSYKIDAVVHFAAFSQVGESVQNPQKYYYNNVFGTLNLLNTMINNGVSKIVFSSTAAVYGEPNYTPIDENHSTKPINPYGKTKLMIENIMDDYDKAYSLKSVRLRYFNACGADSKQRCGEWHVPETHLIPNILKSSFNSQKVFNIFGDDYETKDGTCVRDYIDVEDLAQAHVLALKYLFNGGETNYFNLGTNCGNTVKEVFKICSEIVGKEIDVKICPRREGDPAILIADNSKAKKILGWNPEKTINESIKYAYEWEKILQNKLEKELV